MKIKINQIRTYDDAGFRRRAACLCFKAECETEVMLVTSSRFQDMWVVPGGGLEPGESPETTAKREVEEEAGVVGDLGRLLDVFENEERKTRTYVYVLIVRKLNDEYEDRKDINRKRKWFTLEEALLKLREHKPVQQLYLQKLICDKNHQQLSANCKLHCVHHNVSSLTASVCLPAEVAKRGQGDEVNDDVTRNGMENAIRTPLAKNAFWKDSAVLSLGSDPHIKQKAVNSN